MPYINLTAEENEIRKDKISEAITRKWMWDEEYQAKMREARIKAWANPIYRKKRCRGILVKMGDGFKEFDSIAACSRFFGMNPGSVSYRCDSHRHPEFSWS